MTDTVHLGQVAQSASPIDAERLCAVVSTLGAGRVRAFLSLIEERLAGLAVAGDGADGARARAARVHQCAGSAAALGLTALEAELRSMESPLGGADVADAGAQAQRLMASFATCLPWILRAAPELQPQEPSRV